MKRLFLAPLLLMIAAFPLIALHAADEQAYLDRVRQAIRDRVAKNRAASPQATTRPIAVNKNDWSALVPITDMTSLYKGEDGGLYGGGKNVPSEAHRVAHVKESEKIRPQDANGEPSVEGKIGLITIGFSNTSIESEAFKRAADADLQKSPCVVIVNGAIGGRSAVMWAWDAAHATFGATFDGLWDIWHFKPPEDDEDEPRNPYSGDR